MQLLQQHVDGQQLAKTLYSADRSGNGPELAVFGGISHNYCILGSFSDVRTLANLAINSFSLKLQVTNIVLHCSTSTSIKVCTMKNEKSLK